MSSLKATRRAVGATRNYFFSQQRGIKYESSSARIFKQSKANKVGLSYELDGTLRSGAHDMKVFGLGFLRSVSSSAQQVTVLTSMYFFYGAMEAELDRAAASGPSSAMSRVWQRFPELRRTEALAADLRSLGVDVAATSPSPATSAYVEHIRAVGARDPDLLIGHFYCRYFADLFGGSMLGYPTKVALSMPAEPRFYAFPPRVEDNRQDYIEDVYAMLNAEGAEFTEEKRKQIVEVALEAFQHNAKVLTEEPHMHIGAALGVVKIASGFTYDKLLQLSGAR